MSVKARNLSSDIRRAISENFHPQVRIWPQPNFPPMIAAGHDGMLKRTLYVLGKRDEALNGMADLAGVIAPHGTSLQIEIKAGPDRAKPDQLRWSAWIESAGGIWIWGMEVDQVIGELRDKMIARGLLQLLNQL